MEINELKNRARELVQNSIEQALKFVIQNIKSENPTFDTLLNLNGRYKSLVHQNQNGLITPENKTQGENIIRSTLLDIINNISPIDINTNENEELKKTIAALQNEIQALKSNANNIPSVFKIQIDSNPQINDRPENYKCVYSILDSETGNTFQKETPLIREAGSIIVVLSGIKSTYYVKLMISKRNEDMIWESDHFLPLLSKRTINQINN